VTRTLAGATPPEARPWLGFPNGDVRGLADRLVAWLQAPEDLREATRAALVQVARERYSWDGVARGVIAAARGQLDDLPLP
jgi:glycosyltransferase involved in cell wall biosynthesis